MRLLFGARGLRLTSNNPSGLDFFFFNDPAPPEIYTLPLHDALPIGSGGSQSPPPPPPASGRAGASRTASTSSTPPRSEEHTSELQSLAYLVCRLLLEKKNSSPLGTPSDGSATCRVRHVARGRTPHLP